MIPNSKFIIECINPKYWDGPVYLKKIGPHEYNIDWTDDIYKAKTYDTKQRAEKESARMSNYVKYCFEHGWSSHCYGWDEKNQVGLVMENVERNVREIQITFI